jgi:hypothetical protein
MRAAFLFVVAVSIAGCAQADRRKAAGVPVVAENPPLSARIRAAPRPRAAQERTVETVVEGAVTR